MATTVHKNWRERERVLFKEGGRIKKGKEQNSGDSRGKEENNRNKDERKGRDERRRVKEEDRRSEAAGKCQIRGKKKNVKKIR